ncbi:MAG: ABC transporter permease subunit [Bacteroidetes bacterium]|nr:ABC transporter permease subunit [Bacteroidota bacterium]
MRQFAGSITLTFRELWAMKITLGLFIVTSIAWLMLSFALNLDVVEGSIAALRILGIEANPMERVRDPETGEWIRQVLTLDSFVLGVNQFVFGASYIFGTLLGLFATMPLVAGFLERGRIDLLLSKPISRLKLLAGHIAGVWATVLVLISYLIGAIWIVISTKTGIWLPRFLLAIPIISVMFAVVFSIVILFGVATRSPGFALVMSYGCIFFSAILAARTQIVPQLSALGRGVFLTLYHVLPNYMEVVGIMAQLGSGDAVESWYPLISSILFGFVCYVCAFIIFHRRDF